MSSRRIAAMAACTMMAIMLAEYYLFPKVQVNEVIHDGEIVKNRTLTTSDESFILNAESGNRYNVPAYVYNALDIGDRVVVQKTFLFRKDIEITYCKPRCLTINIGTFNQHYLADWLMGALLIITLLIAPGILKTGKHPTLTYIIFGLAFGIFAFYLIF